MQQAYQFGMVGLGIMGQNLLLNIADNGFSVIGFDKDLDKIAALESNATPDTKVKGVATLADMVQALQLPRTIMLLVPAGKPVDEVIESLLPLIQPGDIIIDGGNSFYLDTLRRVNYLKEKQIHFMGMGVSGGEEGARRGPALMPGGNMVAYEHIQPIVEAIAAKANGEPCVAYMGKGAAGHFVKMVHNGIEYAIMQLITEVYDILKNSQGYSNDEMAEIFSNWNQGELKSYLIEITAEILAKKNTETNEYVIDVILDKAGSKGTGKWTSQEALNLGVPIPTIDAAVTARSISAYKSERAIAANLYAKNTSTTEKLTVTELHDALYAATILCYAQGLSLIHEASNNLEMQVPMKDAVKVWRAGCIIRSTLLSTFYQVFSANQQISNILLDASLAALIQPNIASLRKVAATAISNGISVSAIAASINYFDSFTNERMPTNMIQAQRDFFGAHTYQRIDKEGIFHTIWS